jgi:hypothetical protein
VIGRPINHHVRPGDVVAPTDRIRLLKDHPDVEAHDDAVEVSWRKTGLEILGNDLCMVLEASPYGEEKKRLAFRVFSTSTSKMGWIRSHDVYPVITSLPHPEEPIVMD